MVMFEIVELTPNGVCSLKSLGLFPDGRTAQGHVTLLSTQHPDRKFQPRPVSLEEDWRARELSRFERGEYEALPWDLPPIADHFAHRSKKTPENVAFTASPEDGQNDRQIGVHVNTYLYRFYPQLTVEERRRLVREFTGYDPSRCLVFANSADEIVEVYESGPGSCMAHDESSWVDERHPVRGYWGHGLTVAYLKKDGRITARAVVHLERKIWARVYGDSDELTEALRSKGFRPGVWEGDWQGVELSTEYVSGYRYNPDDDDEYELSGLLAPYVDFANRARLSDDGTKLIVDRCGEVHLQNTEGITEADDDYFLKPCPVCGKKRFGDRYRYLTDEGIVLACGNCTVEKYGYCAASGHPLDAHLETVVLHDGRKARAGNGSLIQCPLTNEWYTSHECEWRDGRYVTPPEMHQENAKAA